MLAEIILLRLEMTMRPADEAGPVALPRFVPLPRSVRVLFRKKLAAA